MQNLFIEINENNAVTSVKLQRGSTLVGSSQKADIRIHSKDVSEIQCQLIFWPIAYGNHCNIVDLNSRFGTFVNGIKLPTYGQVKDKPRFLNSGDEITFGSKSDDRKPKVTLTFIKENDFKPIQQKAAPEDFKKSITSKDEYIKEDAKYTLKRKISHLDSPKPLISINRIYNSKLFRWNPFGHKPEILIDEDLREVTVRGKLLDPPLSKLEFNVIKFLHSFKGRVCSKEEIASNCWPERAEGYVDDAEIHTVINRLRTKLEIDPRNPTILLNRRGFGYILIYD